jgi:hypothetical protein
MVRDTKGRFVKGVSGNPKGRAPKQQELRYYDILVSAVTPERWRNIVNKAVLQAEHGDQAARKWLADYLIGPPVERKELTGADGGPIKYIEVLLESTGGE